MYDPTEAQDLLARLGELVNQAVRDQASPHTICVAIGGLIRGVADSTDDPQAIYDAITTAVHMLGAKPQ